MDFIKQSLQIYADVKNEDGDYVGIGLGSQLSQIFALLMGNPIDHMIKDKYGYKYYIRYMDDGIIIHNDIEKLKEILELIKIESAKYGLSLNENKTNIVRIDKGFNFLKKKIILNPNGSILVKLSKQSITRERRKLKKLQKKYKNGKMPLEHIENSYNLGVDLRLDTILIILLKIWIIYLRNYLVIFRPIPRNLRNVQKETEGSKCSIKLFMIKPLLMY